MHLRVLFGTLLFLFTFTLKAGSSNPDNIIAAGCLIKTAKGFVIAENRLLGRLQLPAGHHKQGETARQTAERETLEETGLKVTARDTAFSLDKNQVIFYFCESSIDPLSIAELKPEDRIEVSRAMILDPNTLKTPDNITINIPWRFPETLWLLKALWPVMNHNN
ncbi:MAG: 8-oxo-dGTP pyrophosphatase MutT (NUDIX family) [Parasphingorhabdus sp.]|jgi:8-oxo-dGTP pyrophosphatase MutT (NUDIX family)